MHVAVTAVPVRILVTRNRLHLHVYGEEIVAGVGPARDVAKEEGSVEPFAQQTSVEVWERQNHGVDRASFDRRPQLPDVQHPRRICVVRAHRGCLLLIRYVRTRRWRR